MIKATQDYYLGKKHEDIHSLWSVKHAEERMRPPRSFNRALSHIPGACLCFPKSPCEWADSQLSLPFSWHQQSWSLASPFTGAARLEGKNKWPRGNSPHPHWCSPRGYLPSEAVYPQDLSFTLLTFILLISPLPGSSDFTSGHHTGSCQLDNPGIYDAFEHSSQLPYFLPSRT